MEKGAEAVERKLEARWFRPGPFHFSAISPASPPPTVAQLSSELGRGAEEGFAWSSDNARLLLRDKAIVVLGDSVQRCVYKDLVKILQTNDLLTLDENKTKLESNFYSSQERLTRMENVGNNRQCIEEREFVSEDGAHLIRYYYITRVYNFRMQKILGDLRELKPDIVIFNSMLWDLSRYGPPGEAEQQFLINVRALLEDLGEVLPPESIFVWNSTLPIASEIAAGFLHNDMKFLEASLRQTILEVNYQVSQLVGRYGFDYLDLHFYMRAYMEKNRQADGTHWDAAGHRHMTDILLTHLAKAIAPDLLQKIVRPIWAFLADAPVARHLQQFPAVPIFAEDCLEELNRIDNRYHLTKPPSTDAPRNYAPRSHSLPKGSWCGWRSRRRSPSPQPRSASNRKRNRYN